MIEELAETLRNFRTFETSCMLLL